jgi:hypothetical protein
MNALLPLFASLVAPLPPSPPSFSRDVAPLLRTHCLSCHAGPRLKGDLDLSSRKGLLDGGTHGPVLLPGKAAQSRLFTHVRDGKMPPRNPLSAKSADLLRRWIAAGAVWEGPNLRPVAVVASGRAGPDWWSLQPLRRPLPPAVKSSSSLRNPVDAFVLAKLEEKGLTFAPVADRNTLIRRVTFDLIGLPPTTEEVEAFVLDRSPDAYERLVDRLLSSPHYGERWGRHWLDVVRFAESHGYEMNTLRPTAWPYRDYVIRALNRDVPYRQFIREQLAGDSLREGDTLTASATGFLVGGPHDLVGNATLEGKLQQRADDLADIAANTGATFLGLTVGCARCHDHKFDPITQSDFYAIQAVFAGVRHADRPVAMTNDPTRRQQAERLRQRLATLEKARDEDEPLADPTAKARRPGVNARLNVERFKSVQARHVRMTVLATTDGTEPCIDELEIYGPGKSSNLALASNGVKTSASSVYPNSPIHRLEHVNDGKHGNSRSWISNERGKGWILLTLPRPAEIDRIVWGRDLQQVYRDRLARDYRIEVSLDGKKWHIVASSADRLPPGQGTKMDESSRLRAELAALESPFKVYAGTFSNPDVIHMLRRGDVTQKVGVVEPGAIAAIRPVLALKEKGEPARRLALAEWIARDDNPLTWRVLANRLWHWHLGQGIVRTPSDFGYNGDRPSHPELLDWLASELIAQGGHLKPVHRLIVLSTTYRQSSRHDATASRIDGSNRLLWRSSPRRLEAEAIRDSMLQVSGALDTNMGGPGYHLWKYSGYVIAFEPKAKLGQAEFRRMIYQFKPRLQQDGTFGAFDCPDATAAAPKRNVSTTALQALNLLNDPFVLEQSERFAARVQREAGSDAAAQVSRAFGLAFGRAPTDEEAKAGERLVKTHGLALLCRALFNAGEFIFLH